MSCVGPALYVPVAVNCWVAVTAIEGDTGVTAMETSVGVGAVTVNVTGGVLTNVPSIAVITEVPAVTPVARPLAEIVATAVVADFQVT